MCVCMRLSVCARSSFVCVCACLLIRRWIAVALVDVIFDWLAVNRHTDFVCSWCWTRIFVALKNEPVHLLLLLLFFQIICADSHAASAANGKNNNNFFSVELHLWFAVCRSDRSARTSTCSDEGEKNHKKKKKKKKKRDLNSVGKLIVDLDLFTYTPQWPTDQFGARLARHTLVVDVQPEWIIGDGRKSCWSRRSNSVSKRQKQKCVTSCASDSIEITHCDRTVSYRKFSENRSVHSSTSPWKQLGVFASCYSWHLRL